MAVIVSVIALAACTHGAPSSETLSPAEERSSTPPTLGAVPFVARCPHTPSPGHLWKRGPLTEVQGAMEGGSLWALVFASFPLRAGRWAKIVWRTTGDGGLSLAAANAGGVQLLPRGLIQHTGSDWNRLGEEWGSEFKFPKVGWWDIRPTRGEVTGDVWFSVT